MNYIPLWTVTRYEMIKRSVAAWIKLPFFFRYSNCYWTIDYWKWYLFMNTNPTRKTAVTNSCPRGYTQRNLFDFSLNQPEIKFYLPFSYWLGTKRKSVWIQINRKMVNKMWFRFDLIRIWKDLCVWNTLQLVIASPVNWRTWRRCFEHQSWCFVAVEM